MNIGEVMNLEKIVSKLKKELVSSPMDSTTGLTITILDATLQFEEVMWLTVRQSVRAEREKWLPLYEAVKELVNLGDSLIEQEPALIRIGAALENLKSQGEEGLPR